ncbi:GAF domain-containing protein [Nocardia sp. NPDC051990]|uniref:helix-turn-helix domain-containing protein n=1 Tax=Nocardia sp. NPDC051990 TaxID=3155285 RepID=UPI003434A565
MGSTDDADRDLQAGGSGHAYSALVEIGTQIQNHDVALQTVFTTIVERTAGLVSADVAWLAVLDESVKALQIVAATGHRHPAFTAMSVRLGTGLGGVALAQRQTISVLDYRSDPHPTPAGVREAVEAEHLVSLVCAPMFRADHMIGALYVGRRRRAAFSEADRDLASALATQVAIAIENRDTRTQLETSNTLLAAKNEVLEQSAAIHERLTAATLRNVGVADIAQSLTELLARPLELEQDLAEPFAHWYGGAAESGVPRETRRIMAGDTDLGRLTIVTQPPLTDIEWRAVEHGLTVLAVELLKQSARREVEWRLGGELLSSLLSSPGQLDHAMVRRGARFGVDLTRPHRVILLEPIDDHPLDIAEVQAALYSAARAAGLPELPRLVTTVGPTSVMVALPTTPTDPVTEFVQAIHVRSKLANKVIMGISRAGHDFTGARTEADACARFARLAGNQRPTVSADDIGPMRFLFALTDVSPVKQFVAEQLDSILVDYGPDSELFRTLRVYLESDGHHPTIASRCTIHKNTVKSRIARISTVLGRPLNDPQVRFELRLALGLHDFLFTIGRLTDDDGNKRPRYRTSS